ncbi:MAG: fructose-bisphosphate aldolase [Deltaproteobacteria bacterium]|nr:MAG: fructose-bisphosphate aldolase [Deltaproteobacteria bacterium]
MIGKRVRLERIINRNTKKTVIVPMDHGVTVGPIPGLIDVSKTANLIAEGGANAAIVHRGAAMFGHRGYGRDLGLIIHLSASTNLSPDANKKVLVATVEDAIRIGADGVSIHVNLGAEDEAQMLEDFGRISSACLFWGMPLVAMMYTRGERIKNPYDVRFVKHAARVAAEMGADIVKVPYTGSPETFREVVEGCAIPVVIAGGEKMDSDMDVLKMVEGAIEAGGAGVSIGRNVFQHENPTAMVRAISAIVHEGKSSEEAYRVLRENLEG